MTIALLPPPRVRLMNRIPGRALRLTLAAPPLVRMLVAYFAGSALRPADNPADKLPPLLTQMVDAVERMALTPDLRPGDYLLWKDTASSLRRIGLGLLCSALVGLCFGIAAGTLPLFSAPRSPLFALILMMPPLSILMDLALRRAADRLFPWCAATHGTC